MRLQRAWRYLQRAAPPCMWMLSQLRQCLQAVGAVWSPRPEFPRDLVATRTVLAIALLGLGGLTWGVTGFGVVKLRLTPKSRSFRTISSV